jgi:trehalose 6-phosphate phosphatase
MEFNSHSVVEALPIEPPTLREAAILLDVDGTIVDLAATPRSVWVPPSLRETLAQLWERTDGALALVSGRRLADLDLMFAPLRLPAIGGHGAEMRPAADGGAVEHRGNPLDRRLKRRFADIAKLGPGILVEDKDYAIALHYRLAPEKEKEVREAVSAICAEVGNGVLEVLLGKSVVEIKSTGFNKGLAVSELMTYPPFTGRRPVFIGDDTTDEAAFAVLPDFSGIGMSVGRKMPGVTAHFETPGDVRAWLERIAQGDGTIAL